MSSSEMQFAAAQKAMVEEQIRRRGVTDEMVLQVMETVPRHEFVPLSLRDCAYQDEPLPIGAGQTVSQPYIVAYMTAALELKGTEKVLEIGTGCGYQAAVLAGLATQVYTVEFQPSLADPARERLERLGYGNVQVFTGDGSAGWPEHAPYDGILVAAAAPQVPHPLLEQLAKGGRLIVPVGNEDEQTLMTVTRRDQEMISKRLGACRFVPLLGRYGWRNASL